MSRISSLSEEFNKLYSDLGRKDRPEFELAQKGAEILGLERIQIERVDGYLMQLLLRLHGAKSVVEFGTLSGYSASHILSALPVGGFLWTLEKEEKHVEQAAKTLASFQGRYEIVPGDARASMETLRAHGPFDAVFLDANKAAYMDYTIWAEQNLRPGGLLIADNILLHGELYGKSERFSPKQQGTLWEMLKYLENSPAWNLTIVPASDGFAVAIKC